MTHLPFTLLAYFFNSLSVVANKFLLNKAIPDPLIYIFYISLLSLLSLLALPFTLYPSPFVLILASISTLLWTLGAYLMFKALKLGQVSRVIPIIGTLIPLILLICASRNSAININQIWAILFLIILGFQRITSNEFWTILILIFGMIVLTAPDLKGRITKAEVINELLSALSFALSYMLLREAYLRMNFLSVIVWSRLILIPLVLILGSFLSLQGTKIATLPLVARNDGSKTGIIFLGGQIAGVLSEFLLLFSISLANPALVNSLQGTQYVFLFFLSREKHPPLVLISKLIGIGLIAYGLYLLAF